ncbi:MAG: Uma2 family endonuclease [Candidatus Poribacteria bacterium]
MSVLLRIKLMTAEELFWLPDDGKRRELVKGELREMPPASGRHGIHGGRLQAYLGYYVLWLDAGVRLVWAVNPQRRTITVYRSQKEVRVPTEEDTLDGGDVAPGPSLPVREVFG